MKTKEVLGEAPRKINSKRKGNEAEREWANWINDVFKTYFKPRYGTLGAKIASRTPRSGAAATQHGLGQYSGDVLSTVTIFELPMKFDSKWYKRMAIYTLWNKHKKETGPHGIPVLGIRANNEKDQLVVMDRNDWAQLVKAAQVCGKKYHEL